MKQYFDFTGKVALVTGGSRGLGVSIAHAFAEQGADVIVASRKLENCQAVARDIEQKTGRRALPFAAHTGQWADMDRLAEAAWAEFGQVDVLVNNAGMSPVFDSSLSVTEDWYDKVLDVNLKGAFRLSAMIGASMVERGSGAIVNISSIAAIRPGFDHAPYAMAKAALNTMTEAHAKEFGPKVRVNAIMPGSFRTDISKHWPADKELNTPAALKRFGEPDEIVSTVLYLASDASSFTTGAIVRVDGGRP